MKLLLILATLALPLRAETANCWIVYAATGDMAIGHATGGVTTLDSTMASRRKTTPVATVNGKKVTTLRFSGGVVSTQRTWAQFIAAEGLR